MSSSALLNAQTGTPPNNTHDVLNDIQKVVALQEQKISQLSEENMDLKQEVAKLKLRKKQRL